MQSRQTLPILDEYGKPAKFGYQGGRPNWKKTLDHLDRSPITIAEEKVLHQGSRNELLATLRDLERNNPVCKSIVQVFTSNIGGCTYQSHTDNTGYDEQREIIFKKYFRSIDVNGFGLTKILQHIVTDLLLAGECFVILTKEGQIQMLPSERVGSSMNLSDMKQEEVDGIVYNRFGKPTQYRVAELLNGVINYQKGTYIPAKDIIHISNTSRIGQVRGTPMLASCVKTLEDIHEVQNAYTAKVKTSSALTGFITSNQPYSARWDENEFGEEPMRSNYKKLYSGSLLLLESGESVQTIQGGSIDGVENFLTQLISFACSAVGITVENLVGWSNASFSSSKATRAVTNHRFKQVREQIEETFLRRLCRWRQFKWENVNELPILDNSREEFSFRWSTSPTLDRRQDAQTDSMLLENGLASPSTIFANAGLDYEAELVQMQKDNDLKQKYLSENKGVGVGVGLKEQLEIYGAGVRSGSITPQLEDENHFREKLGLPLVTDPVTDAWEADGGARRPITLKSQEGFAEDEGLSGSGNENAEEEENLQQVTEEEADENTLELVFATYNDYPQSASNNAKKAIAWKEKNGSDCGTQVGWTRAGQLARREKISRDTIARMASFKRHQQNKDVPYSEGCGGIMWDAWGGTSGIEWAITKLKEIDKKK